MDPRIAAFVNGDRNAGEQLLLELLPRIRNVIRILVGHDRDVDDIAQIVMVNVINSLSGYRAEAPLIAWVDRITARTALAHVKRRRAKEHVESTFEEERPSVANLESPHHRSAEGFVDANKALGYLDGLPDAQREAVVLHHALGYTIAEAAEQQGVTGETFRSRLRLGLGRLRDWCGGTRTEQGPRQVGRTWSTFAPEQSEQLGLAEREQP